MENILEGVLKLILSGSSYCILWAKMRPNTVAGKEQGSLVYICLLLFSVFEPSHQCEREESGIDGPEV